MRNKNIGPILALEDNNNKKFLKIYEISCSDETKLEDYNKFIETLINNTDDNIIYVVVSVIKKNYYTTYLIILSNNLEELIDHTYSMHKIINIFKPYIKIKDHTKSRIDNYFMLPLITSIIRKKYNISTFHYKLIRRHTKYPKRELNYDEYKTLEYIYHTLDKQYIVLGKAVNTYPEINVPLLIDDLYRHTMITGSSGSGKTTTAKKIIKSLIENDFEGYIIVLDWHREYNELTRSNLAKHYTPGRPVHTNLSIPPINCNMDLETSIQVIESILQLTLPQTYLLIKIIEKLCRRKNTITFAEILESLSSEKEKSVTKSELEIIQALYRKLYTITRGQGLFIFSVKDDLSNLFTNKSNKLIIIDLSTIINTKLRTLYGLMLVKTIFERKSLYAIDAPLIVVIEEAHNYIYNNTLLDHIISESRKYDLGFIIIEQSLSNLTNSIIANTSNKIIHTTISPNDLERLKRIIPGDYINTLPHLNTGEAVFMGGVFKKPLIIKIT